jgi:hypothetical protein
VKDEYYLWVFALLLVGVPVALSVFVAGPFGLGVLLLPFWATVEGINSDVRRFDYEKTTGYLLPLTPYRRLYNRSARCRGLRLAHKEKAARLRDLTRGVDEDLALVMQATADEHERKAGMYSGDAERHSRALREYVARRELG